ncbi:hypothetical protein BDQ17DRAFT_1328324 [Cyathus striatus]|nr:hypothetical protein BDQ17DRAFT_1328324 [Cyathus striatus]
MSILAPSLQAPPTPTQKNISSKSSAAATSISSTTTTLTANMVAVPSIPHQKFPLVALSTPTISDLIASKLASSFLGHILFLKSQIPLPIAQLSRITGKKSSPKATKNRTELLSSFDTLSSHLDSTFTALSTALARSSSNALLSTISTSNVSLSTTTNVTKNNKTARAYLAFVLGPGITAPKARVFFAVEGMEVKVWGQREDIVAAVSDEEDDEEEEDEDEDEDDELDEEDLDEAEAEEHLSGSEAPESEAQWSNAEVYGSDEDSGDETEGESIYSELANDNPPQSESEEEVEENIPPPPPTLPTPSELQAADRLLSRTLASFSSNEESSPDDPLDFAAELAATQTHILIRAPRRFSHPAWVPKQNITAGMESALTEFLNSSFPYPSPEASAASKKKARGVKTEGVWIVPSSGLATGAGKDEMAEGSAGDEGDEMIWWTWEAKIAGFSDW